MEAVGEEKVVTGYTFSMKIHLVLGVAILICGIGALVAIGWLVILAFPDDIAQIAPFILSFLVFPAIFFIATFYIWPRKIELYRDHFVRPGSPRRGHKTVRFDEISKVYYLIARGTLVSLGFVLKNGFRFYIFSKEMDNRCQDIMLERLKTAGFERIEKRQVGIFPEFLDKKNFSID